MFSNAIVRTPCRNMVNGITTANLGLPDFELAIQQHLNYIEILESCGVEVTVLPADERFPDSVFVEDIAVFTPVCAVITRPAASSRKDEIIGFSEVASGFRKNIESIIAPGTLEGGDVLMVGSHFFIGISERTNHSGANQFIRILNRYGMTGSVVELNNLLHLKTGAAYLEGNVILLADELKTNTAFSQFQSILVDDDESYAANCIRVNDYVIVPEGFPGTGKQIEKAGFRTKSTDISEFRKLDGGLSCLSLRF